MIELPKLKKEPTRVDQKPEKVSNLDNKTPIETEPATNKAETVTDELEEKEKPSKKQKIEDAHIINSKDDKYYKHLLKAKNLDEIVTVIDNKKIETNDQELQEKMELATLNLKKLEHNINKMLEVFKEDASEEEKQRYVQSLIEKGNDPFDPLIEINDRRIINMATRLMLEDKNINEFFETYFGTQASFDREEWLLNMSQQTGSEELKQNINDLLEKIRETRANPPEVPYFDLIDFLQKLQKSEESLRTPDTNWLKQILDRIDVVNLKQEIEKNIINNKDNTENYKAITSFYDKYLNAGFNPNTLADIDSKELVNDLNNFIQDFLSVDEHTESDIQTIVDFLKELNANELPDNPSEDDNAEDALPDGLRPQRPTTATTNAGDTRMPSTNQELNRHQSVSPGFWSMMKTLTAWKGLEFLFSLSTGLLFAPVTAAIWASKQRVELKKSGKEVTTKLDLSGLEELWSTFDRSKKSSPNEKKGDKK